MFRYNTDKTAEVLKGGYAGDVNSGNSLLSQIQVKRKG